MAAGALFSKFKIVALLLGVLTTADFAAFSENKYIIVSKHIHITKSSAYCSPLPDIGLSN